MLWQAATITDNQTHDQMIDEEEDVDAELQALAEASDLSVTSSHCTLLCTPIIHMLASAGRRYRC